MAPLGIRQIHSLSPAPPRAPKGPSTPPVPVTSSINPRVFGELFAGTMGIFFIAVIFWKVGRFIRSFNRHKVLKQGNATTARYARTWYGWVSLETHNRNKALFRKLLNKIRQCTAWRSSRTDYRWVWWDPGQEALNARRDTQKALRWLPECVTSYDFATADDIWNPTPQTDCHGALIEGPESEITLRRIPLRSSCEENSSMLMPVDSNNVTKAVVNALGKSKETCWRSEPRIQACSSDGCHENIVWLDARMSRCSVTVSFEEHATSASPVTRASREKDHSCSQTKLDDHHGLIRATKRLEMAAAHERLRNRQPVSTPRRLTRDSRMYRVWSAQMQVDSARKKLHDLRDSSGPPGTPSTNVLASVATDPTTTELITETERLKGGHSLRTSTGDILDQSSQSIGCRSRIRQLNICEDRTRKSTIAIEKSQGLKTRQGAGSYRHSLHDIKLDRHGSTIHELWATHEEMSLHYHAHTKGKTRISREAARPDVLNDWELQLIDKLDRKLTWMFNETCPGQKPYHFASLANHWLNRETWLVIDPVSRVSQDARRAWGDPRFNVPYPEPDLSPKSKYPVVVRKRVHSPLINSWRAAVNRQRKISGVRDAICTIELFEDSAEEPPDGHIDPSCWMLPRPPQGFEMSTKQKNAWYEGGAGWQEKLEDWHHVRRGYRLNKALHEGYVNRNRVKEAALHMHRRFHAASCRLTSRDTKGPPPPNPTSPVF